MATTYKKIASPTIGAGGSYFAAVTIDKNQNYHSFYPGNYNGNSYFDYSYSTDGGDTWTTTKNLGYSPDNVLTQPISVITTESYVYIFYTYYYANTYFIRYKYKPLSDGAWSSEIDIGNYVQASFLAISGDQYNPYVYIGGNDNSRLCKISESTVTTSDFPVSRTYSPALECISSTEIYVSYQTNNYTYLYKYNGSTWTLLKYVDSYYGNWSSIVKNNNNDLFLFYVDVYYLWYVKYNDSNGTWGNPIKLDSEQVASDRVPSKLNFKEENGNFYFAYTGVGSTYANYVVKYTASTGTFGTRSVIGVPTNGYIKVTSYESFWHIGPANNYKTQSTTGFFYTATGGSDQYIAFSDGFVMPLMPPTVTTQTATSIETTSFTGNGNITATGGENCTRRGFCYMTGTSGDPTTSDSVAYDDGDFSTGAFTKSITGLTAGTDYRVRAYAVNSAGTSYGSTVDVKTLSSSNFFLFFN